MDQDGSLNISYDEWRDYLLLAPSTDIHGLIYFWRHSTVSLLNILFNYTIYAADWITTVCISPLQFTECTYYKSLWLNFHQLFFVQFFYLQLYMNRNFLCLNVWKGGCWKFFWIKILYKILNIGNFYCVWEFDLCTFASFQGQNFWQNFEIYITCRSMTFILVRMLIYIFYFSNNSKELDRIIFEGGGPRCFKICCCGITYFRLQIWKIVMHLISIVMKSFILILMYFFKSLNSSNAVLQ